MAIFTKDHVMEALLAGPVSPTTGECGVYTDSDVATTESCVATLFVLGTEGKVPRPPAMRQHFVIAAGLPGAGKSIFLERALSASEDNHHGVIVDFDKIRTHFPVYTNTRDEAVKGGASSFQADQVAYLYSRQASIYIYRKLINRLYDAGYDIYTPMQPRGIIKSDVLDGAVAAGAHLHIDFIHASQDVIRESIAQRSERTGRFVREDGLSSQMAMVSNALRHLHTLPGECNWWWRSGKDADAILVASKRQDGRIHEGDKAGLSSFMKEVFGQVDKEPENILVADAKGGSYSSPIAAL